MQFEQCAYAHSILQKTQTNDLAGLLLGILAYNTDRM